MFRKIKTCQEDLNKRSLIYGVGINDADYMVLHHRGGKKNLCQYYKIWICMLTRCYSEKYQYRQPTYKGCYVCKDWLTFTVFKRWMQSYDWKGKFLDKDIINPGNKVYSSENCAFVSREINNLLTDSAGARGDHPIGVNFRRNRFESRISIDGRRFHLGTFKNAKDASDKYITAKVADVISKADEQIDSRLRDGLISHAKIIGGGAMNSRKK